MKNLPRITFLIVLICGSLLSFTQTHEMWGTTSDGGAFNKGTIFKTDSVGGNVNLVYDFPIVDAANPGKIRLCEHPNGKLYGTTISTPIYGNGTIFEYDPISNQTTVKYKFNNSSGYEPNNGMIIGPNGNLYGTTNLGGFFGIGTIFSFNPTTNVYTKIHVFDFNTGTLPNGELLLASNGKMYGLTKLGGYSGEGGLFELDLLTNSVTHKVSFNSDGKYPVGNLIQASNGKLYGLTSSGGTNGYGTLFEYDIQSDTLIKKIDFSSAVGRNPLGSLFEAANGKIYGMTSAGGVNNDGTIFEYSIVTNSIIKKVDFNTITTGDTPNGSFIEDSVGVLLGITEGAIFEYNYVLDSLIVKSMFSTIDIGIIEGDIIKTSNGKYFGTSKTTINGGSGGIYEYKKDSTKLSLKMRFNFNELGEYPLASLMQANNKMIYGVTSSGGFGNNGVVFEYNPFDMKIRKLVNLNFHVYDQLIQASNGKLYGIGRSGDGNVFEIDIKSGAFSILHDFYGSGLKMPVGYLLEASNGKLYGMTEGGFIYNSGIFEYNIQLDTLIEKYIFQIPILDVKSGGLIQANNGKLYGTSTWGGTHNQGTIFEFDILTNTLIVKHNFINSTGNEPNGSLLEISNGVFLGLANRGGNTVDGVLFEFNNNTNVYTVKKSFTSYSNGENPMGSLIKGQNSNYYGLTHFGGNSADDGVLFEYNRNSNVLGGKHLFSSQTTGSNPVNSLTNVFICPPVYDTIQAYSCDVYQAPSGQLLKQSGQFIDIIPNSKGCDSIISIDLIVDHSTTRIDSHLVCNGTLQWVDGLTYTANNDSATFIVSNGASNGCDSIVLLNLTIGNIDQSIISLGNELAANERSATYQWLDCSNNYSIIPNATNQIYRPTTSGSYAVELRKNGCIDTSTCYPITVVGVDENQLSTNLAVFPNPTNSNVTLYLGGLYGAFTTQVYNVHGMLINESAHQSTNQVEVELGESEGIYFIHLITNSGEKVVRKVVKN